MTRPATGLLIRLGLLTLALLGAHAVTALAATPTATSLPEVPGAETEANDSAATATKITSGSRVRGSIFPVGDVDLYSFQAQAGDRVYAAAMTAGSAGSSVDARLALLRSDGVTQIEFDDDNGSFSALSPSIAGATIPTSGTYYLRVSAFSVIDSVRPYDLYLQLRSGSPLAEAEPNDSPGGSGSIGAGWVSGARSTGTDMDFYAIDLKEGDTVFLSLDLDPERDGTAWNGRVGLGLMGDSDNQVLVVDDSGAAEAPNPTIPSEAMMYTVGKDGTYYALVDAASAGEAGVTATYRLSATVLPAAHPTCRRYPVAGASIPDSGSLSLPISVGDSFRIGRAALALDVNHALMADLDVSLRSPAGNEYAIFSDIGSTSPGSQAHMEGVFDDFAAIPPSFVVSRPQMLQPEASTARFGWFEGTQAEGQWRLILRDDTAGNTGSVNAAALILCDVPTQPQRDVVFSAGFEAGAEGFAHSGTGDQWQVGTPNMPATTGTSPVAALSSCAVGSGCFKTNLDGPYGNSTSQDLVSPPIPLPREGRPLEVSWEQWYQMESANFDHASVSIEEEGGGRLRELFSWQGMNMMGVGLGNPATNVASGSGWGVHRADISEFAGKTVRLRFHLDSDGGTVFGGLAIDDVKVLSEPPAVAQPDPALPDPAIRIATLSISPAKFRAATSGPTASASARKGKRKAKQVPTGTTITYTDSTAASTTLTVSRSVKGRKSGGKCVAVRKANRSKPRCNRLVASGSFTHADRAGVNKIHFSGRLKGRKLKPGRYSLAVVARSGTAASNELTTKFTILP